MLVASLSLAEKSRMNRLPQPLEYPDVLAEEIRAAAGS
jgi:hypothetical protein